MDALARDDDCAKAIVNFITLVVNGRILYGIVNYVAKTTLVVLLKKDAQDIEHLRQTIGGVFVKPSRPLVAMSCTMVKATCNYAPTKVK